MSNLSDAFGTPAKAASNLSGLLPPRQRPGRETTTQQPTEQTTVQEAPEIPTPPRSAPPPRQDRREQTMKKPEVPAVRKAPRAAAAGRKLRTAPAMARQSQTFQVPVYVLPEVKVVAEQLRKEDRRITNAQIAFDAIDSALENLYELLRTRRMVDRPQDSLFPSRRAPRNKVAVNERRVLWAIQATADELEVVDNLVAELGAESRSDLISAAVESELLPRAR